MSTRVSDNFSFFVGAFSLMTTVVSVVFFGRMYLPGVSMKRLDETYIETQDLYAKAVSDGLLLDPIFRTKMESELAMSNRFREVCREDVCLTVTFWDEVLGSVTGLSYTIYKLTQKVKRIRRMIATTTQETRKALEQQKRRSMAGADLFSDDETLYTHEGPSYKFTPTFNHEGSFMAFLFKGNTSESLYDSNTADISLIKGRRKTKKCLLCALCLHRHRKEARLPMFANPSFSTACHCFASVKGEPCSCRTRHQGSLLHMMEIARDEFPTPDSLLGPGIIRHQSSTDVVPFSQNLPQAPTTALSLASLQILSYTKNNVPP